MDIQPINKGHVLVIPKKHYQLISEMDNNYVSAMMIIGKKISNRIKQSNIRYEGINFFIADGEAAGQEVPHVHLHIIPRFKNDGFKLVFPKGYENKPDKKELEEIAEKIRKEL
jgi:histidine triad (HIT) family protein